MQKMFYIRSILKRRSSDRKNISTNPYKVLKKKISTPQFNRMLARRPNYYSLHKFNARPYTHYSKRGYQNGVCNFFVNLKLSKN